MSCLRTCGPTTNEAKRRDVSLGFLSVVQSAYLEHALFCTCLLSQLMLSGCASGLNLMSSNGRSGGGQSIGVRWLASHCIGIISAACPRVNNLCCLCPAGTRLLYSITRTCRKSGMLIHRLPTWPLQMVLFFSTSIQNCACQIFGSCSMQADCQTIWMKLTYRQQRMVTKWHVSTMYMKFCVYVKTVVLRMPLDFDFCSYLQKHSTYISLQFSCH